MFAINKNIHTLAISNTERELFTKIIYQQRQTFPLKYFAR